MTLDKLATELKTAVAAAKSQPSSVAKQLEVERLGSRLADAILSQPLDIQRRDVR